MSISTEAPVASNVPVQPSKAPFRWLTFWVSFFAGFFGLIPALWGRQNRRSEGTNDRGYIKAFVVGIVASFVFYVVLILIAGALVGTGSSSSSTTVGLHSTHKPPSTNQQSLSKQTAVFPEGGSYTAVVMKLERIRFKAFADHNPAELNKYWASKQPKLAQLDYMQVKGTKKPDYTFKVVAVTPTPSNQPTQLVATVAFNFPASGGNPASSFKAVTTFRAILRNGHYEWLATARTIK